VTEQGAPLTAAARPEPVAAPGAETPAGDTRDFQRCLVIGGAGMLGLEIVRQLVAAGKQVRILDQQPSPEPLCKVRMGDIRSREDVEATCALRPVGMYGPRDRYHLGNILAMARKGNRLRLGSGRACFSHAYSENVAHAHVCAATHLFPGSPVSGRAYFIGDHYPADNFFAFMDPFLEALDLPVPRRRIPYPVAYGLACVTEIVAPRSNFKRFAVVRTCVDHTYRHDRAEQDFGYRPIVSREEAFRRTLADVRADG
jgi:nucleoside-diphosphate-sugar epimerase